MQLRYSITKWFDFEKSKAQRNLSGVPPLVLDISLVAEVRSTDYLYFIYSQKKKKDKLMSLEVS